MKQRILFQTLLITCLLFCSFPLAAKIVLPALFSDNMVLQRRSEAPIWGTATPNAEVEIITSWDKKIHLVKAGSDGSWFVALRTTQAGGPHFITLSDGAEPVTLKNVMLGEVWLCSGQSNMEMPLAGWGKVLNYKEEIADADYPYIRLLKVKKVASPQPVQEVQTVGGGW
ncbi:MAG: 9-O-acetylesterase, partial [Tannerella sp.]|nr:9-O-acetylesterase [Tannerella sp.]